MRKKGLVLSLYSIDIEYKNPDQPIIFDIRRDSTFYIETKMVNIDSARYLLSP